MLRAVDMQIIQGFEVRGREECTIYSQKKVLVGLENTKQQNRKQPDSPELFCVPN